MIRSRFAVAAVVTLSISASAFAALSPKYANWAKGPEQWLMTRDDSRAWRNVKTDEEAQAFIDLFWARRDPTPGTELNEFRQQFDGRVIQADRDFKSERGKRGSLTDPGRVHILLGPPKYNSAASRQLMMGGGPAGGSAGSSLAAPGEGGGRGGGPSGISDGSSSVRSALGAKMVWEYARPGDVGLAGDVVFIEDITSKEYHYDPQQGGVGGALTGAVAKAIVNRDLKTVPDWAKESHLAFAEPKQVEPDEVETTTTTTVQNTTIVKRGGTTVETIIPPAGAPGAHDFSLIADSRALKPQADADPFGAMVRKTSFTKNDDIGFVFQYCRPQVDAVRTKLKFAILLSGKVNGETVDIEVPEDETMAEPVKTMAGCSIVRGNLPASTLEAGTYSFTVRVTDPATSQSYNLAQDFKIE